MSQYIAVVKESGTVHPWFWEWAERTSSCCRDNHARQIRVKVYRALRQAQDITIVMSWIEAISHSSRFPSQMWLCPWRSSLLETTWDKDELLVDDKSDCEQLNDFSLLWLIIYFILSHKMVYSPLQVCYLLSGHLKSVTCSKRDFIQALLAEYQIVEWNADIMRVALRIQCRI